MLLLQLRPVKSGDQCKECDTGTLVLCDRKPIFSKPGMSHCLFRCRECGAEANEIQDDRFVE
jgi:hypothetical protein